MSYNVTVGPSTSTTVKFGIPAEYAGKTCTTVFALPAHGTMETSDYSLSGPGSLTVDGGAHGGSTFTPTENSKKTIETGPCPAGQTVTFVLSSKDGLSMNLFEDYNPCPVGIYVTAH